jgi:hypothetical protein
VVVPLACALEVGSQANVHVWYGVETSEQEKGRVHVFFPMFAWSGCGQLTSSAQKWRQTFTAHPLAP